MVWDSVVGIVTGYRLDGLGMYAQWSGIFCTHSYWAWGLPRLICSGYWVIYAGEVAGAWS